MIKTPEKVADSTFQFSAPVTVHSPELQQLFDFIAAGAAECDRLPAAKAQGEDAETAAALAASLSASKAKLIVDDLALRSATLLFEVGGGNAIKSSPCMLRLWI
ncbi:putative acyl-CoA dehydrogenase (plasmid) [Scytonema sp. HK-05]|uniref:hypothetical protein n=1 Tax=Scytonema sp. HK-05 TaxID=1137095 RepID=UPI0009374CF5|nr:hypothetical protein [Scytonema sp. HK-05]OKH59433.1 hypothetical protein NIES2130_08915 [Scytonema sp. HK-05]BAY50112.1 putative acyl-CoA dehydrogenase [Scytonema sp. HK-05]